MVAPARAWRFESSPGHNNMRDTTLIFLIKKTDGKVTGICLAMKKRDFGMGKWNGAGGKIYKGESIIKCLERETKEELGVVIKNFYKVAELSFTFSLKHEWDQKTHVYLCEEWEGEPSESEEMNPKWFTVDQIPFDHMWSDDVFWLPQVINGEFVKGEFTFGEGDKILEQKVEIVLEFR